MSAKTILIVDDLMTLRQPARMMLERAGYLVEEAVDGQEALHKIAQSRPDLVLLDLMMPTMNGVEVLKHMRADVTLSDIPVIVVTAAVGRGTISKLGMVDYLLKPFTGATLLDRVHRVLGNGSSAD